MRFRALLLVLSRAIFGLDLRLDQFPKLKSVRGVGISDSEIYAGYLENRFNYTNTYYHREPRIDLADPAGAEFGKYDFVICSDVIEHVNPPVEPVFQTLAGLLRPGGVLILTTPYIPGNETIEHFPRIHESALVDLNGRAVLVNRTADGEYEIFDRLTFHGGPGATLEMRLFVECDLRAKLHAAGFTNVRFDASGSPEFGVFYDGPCSLAIVAAREPFSLCADGITELTKQWVESKSLLGKMKESRWLRLGRVIGLGPKT